jgi:hypothetical protein
MGELGSGRSGSLAVVEDELKLDLWRLKRQGLFREATPLAQSNGRGLLPASKSRRQCRR